MNLDKLLYRLPLVGGMVKRLYGYFSNHIALTDFFHVLVGLGIGLIVAGDALLEWGVLALLIGILFHLYAFSIGNK